MRKAISLIKKAIGDSEVHHFRGGHVAINSGEVEAMAIIRLF